MNEAAEALRALSRAVAAFMAYPPRHPARERALDALLDWLLRIQTEVPRPTFSFLESVVVFDGHPLRRLGEWPWAERLASVGVERVEFAGPVERDDLLHFVDDLVGRLSGGGSPTAEVRVSRPTTIRYGLLDVHEDSGAPRERPEHEGPPPEIDVRVEGDTIRWIEGEVRDHGTLQLAEAEAVVYSLVRAMRGDRAMLLPLARLKEFDQYTTTHALNVSVLAMALAEELGHDPHQVRRFGVSGLLHDLGKVRIPMEILNKPGLLEPDERALIQSHTVEGARLILAQDADLELAAIVAYEHHRRTDGGGYPDFRVPRPCHPASDLVHVCDVYDALRTRRPYRDSWAHERVMDYIRGAAGEEFDRDIVRGFVAMMNRRASATAVLDGVTDPPG